MTHAELYALLKTIGLPVAHNDFKSSPTLPYLIYKESEASAWGSDELNNIRRTGWLVELYTVVKDVEIQRKLESLLDDNGLAWAMSFNDLIESEGLYLAAYEFSTINKIRRD
jgi:hypothetical protein